MVILLQGRVLLLVDDEEFMKQIEDSSFDLARALLAFWPLHEVDWSKSFCLGWFLYPFAQRTVKRAGALAVLE